MSATITSSYVESSVATTYAWLGTANRSASVERRNGVEVRRNLVPNPRAAVDLYLWVQRTNVALTRSVTPAGFTGAKAVSSSTSSSVMYLGTQGGPGRAPVTPGSPLSSSIFFEAAAANTLPLDARIVFDFYSETNYVSAAAGDATRVAAGGSALLSVTAPVPAGAVYVEVYVEAGSSQASGWTYYLSQALLGATGTFFDGATPAKSEQVQEDTSPTLVLGFEASRAARNVYHDVLGGGQDVTLRPADLRRGVLRLFYDTAGAAQEAVDMFTRAAVFYLSEPEVPYINMYFGTEGDMRLALSESRLVWTLDVGYREVTP